MYLLVKAGGKYWRMNYTHEKKRKALALGTYPQVSIIKARQRRVKAPAEARIKRNQSAKVEFKYEHPCPSSGARKGPCKGYVIDHVNH